MRETAIPHETASLGGAEEFFIHWISLTGGEEGGGGPLMDNSVLDPKSHHQNSAGPQEFSSSLLRFTIAAPLLSQSAKSEQIALQAL